MLHNYKLRYLFKEYIEALDISEISFLCPQRISHAEIKKDHLKVQSYLQSAFKTERLKGSKHRKFILAPYIEKYVFLFFYYFCALSHEIYFYIYMITFSFVI